jgi:hypothetical protein
MYFKKNIYRFGCVIGSAFGNRRGEPKRFITNKYRVLLPFPRSPHKRLAREKTQISSSMLEIAEREGVINFIFLKGIFGPFCAPKHRGNRRDTK